MELNNLPPKLKQKIDGKDMPTDTLAIIKDWPADLLEVIFSFKLGTNKIAQIIGLLKDISLRDNKPIDAPLKFPEWLSMYNSDKIPMYQKGVYLRQFLLGLRYPVYTQLKDRIKQIINKLNLPKNISIMQDELLTLEKESISVKIECKSPEELKHSAQILTEISEKPEIKELLSLLKI